MTLQGSIHVAAALAFTLVAGHALAHKAHSHGVARMDVAVEGTAVRIELAIALEDLVGFERTPGDEREKAALEAATAKLKDAAVTLALAPEAKCKAVKEEVEVAPAKASGEAKHADAIARYAFACASPPRSLDANVFDAFKRIRRVDARTVTATGQSSAKLTGAKRRLSW